MPNPWKADYNSWKREFEKLNVNGKTILIGHSCGCSFLVRWLGETKKLIDKLVLVAPWKIPHGKGDVLEAKKKFYDYSIDYEIKSRVKSIAIFTADNEEKDGKKECADIS